MNDSFDEKYDLNFDFGFDFELGGLKRKGKKERKRED